MKFCPKCGAELADQAQICPTCSCSQPPLSVVQDSSSFGFALLGFLIPVAGLVLYLVWKDTMPLKAKSAGKGALVSAILSVGLSLLVVILYILLIVFAIMSSGI
ncbi:MAG: zinc ribbon domain-containing protein [Clostridia bacterium]|nr:zinc ribbon domain-containing protein [Clostridia bacterium]